MRQNSETGEQPYSRSITHCNPTSSPALVSNTLQRQYKNVAGQISNSDVQSRERYRAAKKTTTAKDEHTVGIAGPREYNGLPWGLHNNITTITRTILQPMSTQAAKKNSRTRYSTTRVHLLQRDTPTSPSPDLGIFWKKLRSQKVMIKTMDFPLAKKLFFT